MARPQKVGLDYFPLDVDMDQDDKIAMIEALHGIEGFGVIIKLFMKIYNEGYFYKWTESEQILFSRRINVDIKKVNAIIKDCIKWNVFNDELFEKYQILTSKGIQLRYLEIVKRRIRVEVIQDYILVNDEVLNAYNNIINVNINEVNADINRVNDNIGTQRKEKKRKEYIYSDSFTETLKLYPGKKVKSIRDKKLPNIVNEYGEEQIIRCIERYANEVKGKDKQFILNESTFWNGRFKDYLDEDFQDEEIKKPKEKFEPKFVFRDL
jgi:hypothetical protein